MPTAPWTLNARRDSKPKTEEVPAFTQVTLKVGGGAREGRRFGVLLARRSPLYSGMGDLSSSVETMEDHREEIRIV
jgi:hypothetical protein